ncbi:MAG: hypothetical protein KAR00_00840 [Candidatus Pacebacteria bacterium]|nr:hypothetical protein [Candidatus Paceibacterota bacterium]
MSKKVNVGIGVGVAAAAATLAGCFLYGKNGKKRLKKLKGWTLKAKGEIVEKVEQLKEMNEEAYYAVVDQVLHRYTNAREVGEDELLALSSELKKHWKDIKGEFETAEKKTVKRANKSLKRVISAAKK